MFKNLVQSIQVNYLKKQLFDFVGALRALSGQLPLKQVVEAVLQTFNFEIKPGLDLISAKLWEMETASVEKQAKFIAALKTSTGLSETTIVQLLLTTRELILKGIDTAVKKVSS